MIAEMESIYASSAMLTNVTEEKHEVDHTIPLVNPDICGLHVPWNMRVLTRQANRSKHNRIPDDPADWCAWPHALDLPR